MSSKVMLLAALCVLCSCWGDESSTQGVQDVPMEPLNGSSDDLERDATFWRHSWKPWKIFKWGHHNMFNNPLTHSSNFWESANGGHHIHQDRRTLTRRESSLIVPKKYVDERDYDKLSTCRTQSAAKLISESTTSVSTRPRGSVKKELVGMMFESMLDSIVESWEVIVPVKLDESTYLSDFGKSPSEITFTSKKKKPIKEISKARSKRSRSSKLELLENQMDPLHQIWSAPDERAIIRFKNGNVYEGNISMKSMNDEGRFQWADGTVYLGQFKNNEINGKGLIQWKDDTWYEGDFVGNVRHGRGLYVDSRKQRSYAGGWHCGAKHGQGIINYSSFNNSYDGEWIHNVRHGFGSREYSGNSGYKGEWDRYVREGKGMMIWPNHDFFRGEWKNGVMSGYGIYIWDEIYNNSMSLPSMNAYRGFWEKGERSGYGFLNLGVGLGSYYKGEYIQNKKHGPGKLVINGLILKDKKLFVDDNLGPKTSDQNDGLDYDTKRSQQPVEPLQINICDDSVGLFYHVQKAFENIDKQDEIRTNMVNDYLENNKSYYEAIKNYSTVIRKENVLEASSDTFHIADLLQFEESSLRKALRCYETDLKNIYYKYATICNTEEIHFTPIIIHLYLWQFYNDCNVHEKGLNLVEIDRIFHEQPWLSLNPHNPFEKIYFWQFLQSLISVAMKLYAKRELPTVKPDTILASAFRTFMDKDALPGVGRCKGMPRFQYVVSSQLTNSYGSLVPLKGAYKLYRALGEPHTVRKFLCAVRQPPHFVFDSPQPPLVDAPDEATPIGRNLYVFGDDITFVTDDVYDQNNFEEARKILKLFNFGNLSSKTIIKIFTNIFPHMCTCNKIMDLDVELTFYEFFEAIVACAEESVRVKDEEMRWREKLSFNPDLFPNPPSPSPIGNWKPHKQ